MRHHNDHGHLRLRHHRRRSGRRGGREQGAGARGERRDRRPASGSADRARTSAACRPSRSSTRPPRHAANPANYDWARASARRDYMVNRPPDAEEPDDSGHVKALEDAGAVTFRGTGRIVGRGRVDDHARRRDHARSAAATSSSPSARRPRSRRSTGSGTSRTGRTARRRSPASCPKSLLVLGGGPTGCELSQVYARFGVPGDDRPVRAAAHADRASPQLRGRARRPRARSAWTSASASGRSAPGPGPAPTAPTRSTSTTGRPPKGHAVLLAVGRDFGLDDLGLEHYGLDVSQPGRVPARRPAPRRRRAVGRRRSRPARSSTPTRATTRASSRCGWPSARRSCPTTAPCRGRRTPTRRPHRSG